MEKYFLKKSQLSCINGGYRFTLSAQGPYANYCPICGSQALRIEGIDYVKDEHGELKPGTYHWICLQCGTNSSTKVL